MGIEDLRGELMDTGKNRRSEDDITDIALHYSGTDQGNAISFQNYWRSIGWFSSGGYNEIVLTNGVLQLCYDPTTFTHGVLNHNLSTYHIAYVGSGAPNEKQWPVIIDRLRINKERFKNVKTRNIKGHREFSGHGSNPCPQVDMNKVRNAVDASNVSEDTQDEPIPVPNSNVPYSSMKRSDRYTDATKAINDAGYSVRHVQNLLLAVGEKLPRFGADDKFGEETESAIQAFQARHDISSERGNFFGRPGPSTLANLLSRVKYPGVLRAVDPFPRGESVRQLQRAIDRESRGIYGPNTANKVKEYQRQNKLQIDGITGPETWTHLFGTTGGE